MTVHVDTDGVHWRKSSYSQNNGNCVEMGSLPDGQVAVRDTKDRAGGSLIFARAEIQAWISGAKDGEFDDLT